MNKSNKNTLLIINNIKNINLYNINYNQYTVNSL